jgi:hypothetical protein
MTSKNNMLNYCSRVRLVLSASVISRRSVSRNNVLFTQSLGSHESVETIGHDGSWMGDHLLSWTTATISLDAVCGRFVPSESTRWFCTQKSLDFLEAIVLPVYWDTSLFLKPLSKDPSLRNLPATFSNWQKRQHSLKCDCGSVSERDRKKLGDWTFWEISRENFQIETATRSIQIADSGIVEISRCFPMMPWFAFCGAVICILSPSCKTHNRQTVSFSKNSPSSSLKRSLQKSPSSHPFLSQITQTLTKPTV